jgi:glycosylphosphatidylinositol transamidase (GPIT) subunit GPI8
MWDKTKPDVLDRRQVTLTRSKHGIVIEDWFTKIKLVKKQTPSSHYYLLLIEGLQSGEYNLQIRGEKDH